MTLKLERPILANLTNKFFTILLLTLSIAFIGCDKDDDDLSAEAPEIGICLVLVDGVFTELEIEKPVYLDGGDMGLLEDLYLEISYPSEARENGVEGTCVAQFEITEIGSVENIKIILDPGAGIGEEVLETFQIIMEGVPYRPGMLNGKAVRVRYNIPVKLRLG